MPTFLLVMGYLLNVDKTIRKFTIYLLRILLPYVILICLHFANVGISNRVKAFLFIIYCLQHITDVYTYFDGTPVKIKYHSLGKAIETVGILSLDLSSRSQKKHSKHSVYQFYFVFLPRNIDNTSIFDRQDNRAAQFSPFDVLTGYEEAIEEAHKKHEPELRRRNSPVEL